MSDSKNSEAKKKVIVKNPVNSGDNISNDLSVLHKRIDGLSKRMNILDVQINHEVSFLKENQDSDITLTLINGKEVIGSLIDIDRYRISIKQADKIIHFYKHGILGYGKV